MFVFRDDAMAGLAVDFFIKLHQYSILEDGYPPGGKKLFAIELWRQKKDVECLPFAGRTGGVDQRWRLAVNGSTSAIGINFFIERIEDLDFIKSHQEHAIIAAIVPRSFEINWRHPFDVKLDAAEVVDSG